MCRFLLAKSEKSFNPNSLIKKFAEMSKASKAYDGDSQGDGCGVSWMDKGKWQTKTSIKPIWESTTLFSDIPSTTNVIVHARSASFPKHKGVLEYNQPYVYKNYAFVFNGLLKGVALPYQLEGTIGAQKIWSLLKKFLVAFSPNESLLRTVDILNKHTKTIQALNIGLSDRENIYFYCQYNSHPHYYNLRVHTSDDMKVVCSEDLPGMKFEKIERSMVHVL